MESVFKPNNIMSQLTFGGRCWLFSVSPSIGKCFFTSDFIVLVACPFYRPHPPIQDEELNCNGQQNVFAWPENSDFGDGIVCVCKKHNNFLQSDLFEFSFSIFL